MNEIKPHDPNNSPSLEGPLGQLQVSAGRKALGAASRTASLSELKRAGTERIAKVALVTTLGIVALGGVMKIGSDRQEQVVQQQQEQILPVVDQLNNAAELIGGTDSPLYAPAMEPEPLPHSQK